MLYQMYLNILFLSFTSQIIFLSKILYCKFSNLLMNTEKRDNYYGIMVKKTYFPTMCEGMEMQKKEELLSLQKTYQV